MPTHTTSEKLAFIRLARSENIGKSTFFRLLKIFGSAEKALQQLPEYLAMTNSKRKINLYSVADAEEEIAKTEKFKAKIICFYEDQYPQLLRQIPDPAPIITIKGDESFLHKDCFAIVGPRNASFHAVSFAKKITQDLSKNSLIIVSGLARGIDTAAHSVSLKSGTIAVIAGGIDHIYPKENAWLYDAIANEGLLLSENIFSAPPKGGSFVQRNRIISGLSLGVLVVEAGLKSGSLITARYAAEQGREVFAVPGSPLDPRCHGTNRLIKEGVKLTENADDILEEMPQLKSRFGNLSVLMEESENIEFEFSQSKSFTSNEINAARLEILSLASFVPIAIEQIIQTTNLPARLVNIAIIQLELIDKIEVIQDKIVLKSEFC